MSSEGEELELDIILSVLENPVRRKILRKLSRETNYPLQLSKELNVSQQAIMKHLRVLEENNFVESFEERSDKGGPPRKVYAPRRRYCIRIDIGPNTYAEEFYSFRNYDVKRAENNTKMISHEKHLEIKGKITGEMKDEIVAALPAFADPNLEKMRIQLESLINQGPDPDKAHGLNDIITQLEMELSNIEKKRRSLLALKERTNQEINILISQMSEELIEREVLSLFIKEGIRDIDKMSERLNVRRIRVEQALKRISNN